MAIFEEFEVHYLLCIPLTLFFIVYIFFKIRFMHWLRNGVPQLEPSFPFGNRNILKSISLGEDVYNICCAAKARDWRYFGMYLLARPMFITFDLDMLKNMMTRDFNHFADRGLYFNERDDPLSAHLFTIGGTKWRNLRAKFTPTFTPGKMRMMLPTLLNCGSTLEEYVKEHNLKEPLDVKSVIYCYGINVIGSCAFGIECNTFKESGSSFSYYGMKIFHYDKKRTFNHTFTNAFPTLAKVLRRPNLSPDVANFFLNFVKKTVRYREDNNVSRNDFMQQLIDIKNNKESTGDGIKLTLNQLAAQCFIFFAAGFETSSAAATFAFYELAIHQDIQDRVREELKAVLKKHNNKFSYDAFNDMVYMQQVMDETLRKYPVAPLMSRVCTEDYKIPNTNIILKKGTGVFIPIKSIHWDENVYKDPWKFDPERFSEENKKDRHPFSFIPFGEGPRICIGVKFGILEFKLALASILKNFRVKLNPRTPSPLKISHTSLVHTPEGGVWLDLERI